VSEPEQTEIRKKGLAKMSEVYGWEMSDGPGDYFEHTCDQVFGTVWTREGLSNRDRRLLLFGALASAGLPALAGFPGEFLVLLGGFTGPAPFPALTAAATSSVVLAAAYLLWTVKRVAYGPLRHAEQAAYPDLDGNERLALLPLAVLVLLVGVWPQPLVAAVKPACELFVQMLHNGVGP